MTRSWHALIVIILLGSQACWNDSAAANPQDRITDVTLYRNQALVTREIRTELGAGDQMVVVSNLPQHVVADSLSAVGNSEIEIRAIQFRSHAVSDSPHEQVRELQDQIRQIEDQIQLNQKKQEVTAKQAEYLDRLEGFVAPTATTELSQGVLNAEALREMTEFSFQQREQVLLKQVELQKEQRSFHEEHELLTRKLSEISAGNNRTVREAVIFVHKVNDQSQTIQLNYLVNQCGWAPTYTVFSSEKQETTKLEYHGLIHQMTGEDWQDVRITLSTAFPSISAAGPGLAPLRLTLSNMSQTLQTDLPQQQAASSYQSLTQSQVEQMVAKQRRAVVGNFYATNNAELNESNWNLNTAANELACAYLNGESSIVNRWNQEISQLNDEPSLSYELTNPVSLPSRQGSQMVRIASTQLPSQLYHVATPVLTNYIYREAEMTNNSEYDFLGGPILVYFDDRFVGRGEIPTVTRGQRFVVGLGADPQLRTHRELVQKTDGIHGGNHELSFEYRLFIENYKGQNASVRLIDRVPTAENGADVRIRTNHFSEPLSQDETYVRVEKPEGILRWDVTVPNIDDEQSAYEVSYTYTVEYDRNYVVALPSSLNKIKQDFERMQRDRAVK